MPLNQRDVFSKEESGWDPHKETKVDVFSETPPIPTIVQSSLPSLERVEKTKLHLLDDYPI